MPVWFSYYIHYKVWDKTINQLPTCSRWSLGKDIRFHPTLYWAYDYLINQCYIVSEKGRRFINHHTNTMNPNKTMRISYGMHCFLTLKRIFIYMYIYILNIVTEGIYRIWKYWYIAYTYMFWNITMMPSICRYFCLPIPLYPCPPLLLSLSLFISLKMAPYISRHWVLFSYYGQI